MSDAGEGVYTKRMKQFLKVHWLGVVIVVAPLISLLCLLSEGKHAWCAYCLTLMALYWMTECIPLPITAFLPIVIFPMTGILDTSATCKAYMNDTIIMFIGSMVLAYAIEQSNLHIRMALLAIRIVGYSHYKLLFAICFITMFVSMWITNTAATTMMMPIVFAVLKVFENQGLIKVFENDEQGQKYASDISTCYFCSVTYSATIGGIGTLVGTITNLVFKGLFAKSFPDAPEYMSFLKFSAFGVPLMLLLEGCTFFYMIVIYLGFLRPRSKASADAKLSQKAIESAKKAVATDWKKLGRFTFWETMAMLLFLCAVFLFFFRSPQIFTGWGDRAEARYGQSIKDSAVAMLVGFFMFLLPNSLKIFQNFTAKTYKQLPKEQVTSVLDFRRMNLSMPYSFMFLLGGGFALSKAAEPQHSNLNGKIGEMLKSLEALPKEGIIFILIIFTVFLTNFASNVAVCNILSPIAMQLGKQMKICPMWFNLATGIAASFCFCLPVGTPGNLIVQSAANVKTSKMIVAGIGPTLACIVLLFLLVSFFAPLLWPGFHEYKPEWYDKTTY